ncbi:MAG: glycoside hydrolase family 57 protein [Candidatus Paceibacterota bacterium]
MATICPYFQVHQPYRLRPFNVFETTGADTSPRNYFNDDSETSRNNQRVLRKVARKSYLPTNEILLELLEAHPEFRVSFSFSGVVLEQFAEYSPEVLESFQRLVATGQVEVLAETYHHSLAFFYDRKEFERQVEAHTALIEELFGLTPQVFRNTELAYNNDLGLWADQAGYKGVLAEGWDGVLGWRSPNFLYHPPETKQVRLLLKNYKLSDDIAFRFSDKEWEGWPLTAEKFASWINDHNADRKTSGELINLFIDYETFGEHQWEDTGIFDFLRRLPGEILDHPDNTFMTPSEVVAGHESAGEVDVPEVITWADTERDLSAWLGNDMQRSAVAALYDLRSLVEQAADEAIHRDWQRLQTSDHLYYMCTKWFSDGDVHAYFNPHESPYEAFITYMNVLSDVRERCYKATAPPGGKRLSVQSVS